MGELKLKAGWFCAGAAAMSLFAAVFSWCSDSFAR